MGRTATYDDENDLTVRYRLSGIGLSKQYIYKIIKNRHEGSPSAFQTLIYNLALNGEVDYILQAYEESEVLKLENIGAVREATSVERNALVLIRRTYPTQEVYYWSDEPDKRFSTAAEAREYKGLGNRLATRVCVYNTPEMRIMNDVQFIDADVDTSANVDVKPEITGERHRSRYGNKHFC